MRIRLLHILPNLAPGGAERMVVNLVRDMDHDRYDVTVVSMFGRAGWELEQTLDTHRIRTIYLNKHRGPDIRMYPRIDKVVRAIRPNIVHTHIYSLRYALPSLLYRKVPHLVHTVNNLAEKDIAPQERWIHRIAFRRGTVPVAVAREVAASITRVYGIENTPVIPNAIPLSRYQQPRVQMHEWRASEGYAPNDILFGSVARLFPQKNHRMMLDAFAQGPARHGRTYLLLAGEGPLRSALERQAADLGISDRVRFLGIRADVPDLLNAIDVFVLSSNWEGNPLAVMEAMASGCPVISTPAGGVPELIDDGCDGFLVPFEDTVSMSARLDDMVQNAPLRRSTGQRARQRAAAFDSSIMARSYEKLYENLLAERAPS